jgi:hypothetical protein
MDYRSNPTASTIRCTGAWLEIPTNTYLDHRHRNWVLAEELGDVVFVEARGVVLVHRHWAEHIARALGWRPEMPARQQTFVLPSSTTAPSGIATAPKSPLITVKATTPWRAACRWLGIVAGAAVFVAALAVPLDDPALVVALMMTLRSGLVAGTA